VNINAAIETLREAIQEPDADLWWLMDQCLDLAHDASKKIKEKG